MTHALSTSIPSLATPLRFAFRRRIPRIKGSSPISLSVWLQHSLDSSTQSFRSRIGCPTPPGSTLIGLLTDNLEDLAHFDPTALHEEYKAAGINLILVAKHRSEHSTEQSHVMIIRNMLQHAQDSATEPHWLGIIDNDTFSPSLYALASAFSNYDHTKPQYLGQLTESAHILPIGILSGFGGAGIFLARPLAQIRDPHLESCLKEFPGRGGDMQVMSCIYAHSFAKLTIVDGLYQVSSF